MTILEKIKSEINEVISRKYNVDDINFDVSFIDEANKKFGDISTNVALILSKIVSKSPIDTAEEIISDFKSEVVDSLKIAGPGFINITLNNDTLALELEKFNRDNFYIETKFTNKKILVEHSAINLFKPFHIGHLMNNTIGKSISQMMKMTNSDLRIVSFPSDISIGIAKAIYILKNKNDWNFNDEDIIKKLGDSYVEGVRIYSEDESVREDINHIAKNLFEENRETEDWKIFEESKKINIEYFEKALALLGTHFDKFIYESEAGKVGEEIIKENINLNLSEEVFTIGEGGAIVFDTKKRKNKETDETIKSVFINSEGNPTYEAKDLGLLYLKDSYFPFDYNFFVTDSEQTPHFEVVLAAAKELGERTNNQEWIKISEKSSHIPHGRLNLKGERMSSRLGNILTAEETLDIVNKKTEEKLSEKTLDLSNEEKEDLIRKISLSALRIAILKSKPGLNIDFDFETSLSFDGATGPYLLYTYARANSILNKAKDIGFDKLDDNSFSDNQLSLIKKIIESESLYKRSIEDIAPQLTVKYLFELAGSFNGFYGKEKIIDDNDFKKTQTNLYLTNIFMKTLKIGLNLLGIDEVERM